MLYQLHKANGSSRSVPRNYHIGRQWQPTAGASASFAVNFPLIKKRSREHKVYKTAHSREESCFHVVHLLLFLRFQPSIKHQSCVTVISQNFYFLKYLIQKEETYALNLSHMRERRRAAKSSSHLALF